MNNSEFEIILDYPKCLLAKNKSNKIHVKLQKWLLHKGSKFKQVLTQHTFHGQLKLLIMALQTKEKDLCCNDVTYCHIQVTLKQVRKIDQNVILETLCTFFFFYSSFFF